MLTCAIPTNRIDTKAAQTARVQLAQEQLSRIRQKEQQFRKSSRSTGSTKLKRGSGSAAFMPRQTKTELQRKELAQMRAAFSRARGEHTFHSQGILDEERTTTHLHGIRFPQLNPTPLNIGVHSTEDEVPR